MIYVGINVLNEGVTICYPENLHSSLKVLATGTDGYHSIC